MKRRTFLGTTTTGVLGALGGCLSTLPGRGSSSGASVALTARLGSDPPTADDLDVLTSGPDSESLFVEWGNVGELVRRTDRDARDVPAPALDYGYFPGLLNSRSGAEQAFSGFFWPTSQDGHLEIRYSGLRADFDRAEARDALDLGEPMAEDGGFELYTADDGGNYVIGNGTALRCNIGFVSLPGSDPDYDMAASQAVRATAEQLHGNHSPRSWVSDVISETSGAQAGQTEFERAGSDEEDPSYVESYGYFVDSPETEYRFALGSPTESAFDAAWDRGSVEQELRATVDAAGPSGDSEAIRSGPSFDVGSTRAVASIRVATSAVEF